MLLVHGSEEMTSALLQASAKPNVQDVSGNTPLHLAAEYGHKAIVKMLMDAGATSMSNSKGHTPADVASQRSRTDVLSLLKA